MSEVDLIVRTNLSNSTAFVKFRLSLTSFSSAKFQERFPYHFLLHNSTPWSLLRHEITIRSWIYRTTYRSIRENIGKYMYTCTVQQCAKDNTTYLDLERLRRLLLSNRVSVHEVQGIYFSHLWKAYFPEDGEVGQRVYILCSALITRRQCTVARPVSNTKQVILIEGIQYLSNN